MVYLLEPKPYKWIRTPGVPTEVVRKLAQGIPLEQPDIPTEMLVKGRLALPDICHANDGCLIVSDRFRAVFEELVPDLVTFFLLGLKGPENMLAGRNFFLFDVLPRAQLIDWDQSPTGPRVVRAPDGRESRSIKGLMKDPSIKFKAVTSATPLIWREADVDRPTVHFFANKMDVFLRDELWDALNARFPDQLVARKLA